MSGRWSYVILLGMVGWMAEAKTSAGDARPSPAETERAMTASIDEHLARSWAEAGIEPAPVSTDAEFLRRISLDIVGKIPTVAEAREFLDDTDPEKRRKLVARLLKGPTAATHFVNVWRPLLIPETTTAQLRTIVPDFDRWLRGRFEEKAGFDATVRELLTYPIDQNVTAAQAARQAGTKPSPLAFYSLKAYKAEDLAASTARLFLGVRIECAQCHDHPFATWKRDQFWQLAASFASFETNGPANSPVLRVNENSPARSLLIPGTDRRVPARYLDGTSPQETGPYGREALADWITSPTNPFFARAIVNRTWAQLMGIGIVDPVDDFSDSNPPSHPELLDELARRFIESKYDLPLLLRAIAASRAYQLTSEGSADPPDDPHQFARMAVKGMSAEQWYDSLIQATGLAYQQPSANPRIVAVAPAKAAFLEKFTSRDEHVTDRATSILQALALMHGPLVAEATDPNKGPILGAIIRAPFLDTRGRIEALYFAALTRPPRPEELARMLAYVEAREPDAALADIFWALLNGAEFAFNH